MRRITVTLPDDLEQDLEHYLTSQRTPPSLTTLMQTALRGYLQADKLRQREYRPAKLPFNMGPIIEQDDADEARCESPS